MKEKVNILTSLIDWIIKTLKTKTGNFVLGIGFGIIISFPTIYSFNKQVEYLETTIKKKDVKIEELEIDIRESNLNHVKQWGEMLTLLTTVDDFLNKKNKENNSTIKENRQLLEKQNETIKLLQKLYENN